MRGPRHQEYYQGSASCGASLDRADKIRNSMLQEADLLDALGGNGSPLRAVVGLLSISSLERIYLG